MKVKYSNPIGCLLLGIGGILVGIIMILKMKSAYAYEGISWMEVFVVVLAFSFAMIAFGFLRKEGKLAFTLLGGGMLVLGIGSVVCGILEREFAMLLLAVFAPIGVLVLYKAFFVSEEENQKVAEEYENKKLMRVKDIIKDEGTAKTTVLFSIITQSREGNSLPYTEVAYFSYDMCGNEGFQVGDIFAVDTSRIVPFFEKRTVLGYETIDISCISREFFEDIPKIMQKMFKMVEQR